ncbi:MAG TPA: hypothetical protein VEI01_02375 [Terriglobales bacterium]|nr:hypothetical protein [Terriglobales bacterium]
MTLVGTTPKRRRDVRPVLILSLSLIGLLFTGSVPPSVPHSLFRSNVISQAHHSHKQYFDDDYSQWADHRDTPLAMPPLTVSFHPVRPADRFVETVTHGLHYNRPPPLF